MIKTLVVTAVFICSTATVMAQSANSNTTSQRSQEQSLQDLVNEVRQLRAMLLRVNTTVYRANVVVERMKIQQELVSRGSRDLDDVREQLGQTRVDILKLKETVKQIEADAEAGVKDPAGLAAAKLELENAVQREIRLIQRETQLTNDLSTERLKLFELNERLTKLEMELTPR
jgi:hypothetical protein